TMVNTTTTAVSTATTATFKAFLFCCMMIHSSSFAKQPKYYWDPVSPTPDAISPRKPCLGMIPEV
ncbi:hypothetical protein, partial [Methanoculleus sp.]|uniref:hypothetical protein n=1 Tax=Methanoculleus sp. TaxID=90427 RepID=UPI00262A8DAC